jgi:uncharacterized protein YfaS (alpha-2-macroglobulin family)
MFELVRILLFFYCCSGAKVHTTVHVTREGKDMPNVEVCLVVVDDSVLSLTGYKVSSPLELFYPKRNVGFL